MRFAYRGCRALLVLCLVRAAAPHRSLAGGVEACGAHADTGQSAQAEPLITKFYPHRQGTPRTDLTARDLEFLWDSLYVVGFTANVRSTLDRLNQALVFTQGASPIALDGTNLQVLYNYFRTQGADWNPFDPRDSLSFRIGRNTDGTYNNADRDHADYYIRHPSRPTIVIGSDTEGSYPASEITLDEDVSTDGRAFGDFRHGNSVTVEGPEDAQALDLSGTGWTAVGARRRTLFNHELKHALPGGENDEFWSAAAEVVGGITDTTASFEIPYTWPVNSHVFDPAELYCTSVDASAINRRALSNYQGRTSFLAYVAYNFLNADTARTLQGMTDDLLYKWAKGLSPSVNSKYILRGLGALLRDSLCATCSTKGYFHPSGATLSDRQRLNVLLHNWRAANFVSNPDIAEGQYGFPAWAGFNPAKSQKAWQDFDNCGFDDIVAIPAVVTLGPRQVTRDTALTGMRAFRGAEMPLNIPPLGANYWVIRADPSLVGVARDLVIRIAPKTCVRCMQYAAPSIVSSTRALLASAIGYSRADTIAEAPNLWRYPSSASYVSPVYTVDVDTVERALEITIPNFGTTQRSVLLVLSAGDGPGLRLFDTGSVVYEETLPYRLELGLRTAPYMQSNPAPVAATPGYTEATAAWSPKGDALTFMAVSPSHPGLPQIYVRKLDGTTQYRMAPLNSPQYEPDWSPRGDLVAFESASTASESGIWLGDPQGAGPPVQLTNLSGLETAPAFQPDGQGLAYYHLPPDSTRWQLRYIRLNGSGDRLVGSVGYMADVRRPRWSADGTKVCCSIRDRGDSLFSFPKYGGQGTPLVGSGGRIAEFDFHPGVGRLLAQSTDSLANSRAEVNETLCAPRSAVAAIRVALFDTTSGVRDTSIAASSRTASFQNPRWAPEGTRIVYDLVHAASNDRDIYVQQVSWNHAPTFNQTIGDQTLTACQPFSMSLAATDPDNEPISILTYSLPPGAVMSGTNMLWVRPPAGTFYTIFKAIDGSGGVASKVVRFTVTGSCGGFLSAGSGGGSGGGTSSRGAERTSALPGQTAVEGSSLLDGAEPGTWVSQLARVATTASDQLSLAVTAGNSGAATLDQARLVVFDHAEGTSAVVSAGGPVAISSFAPASASNSDGSPIALEPDGQLSQPVVVPAGTVVTLSWAAGSLPQGVALDCQRPGPAEWGEDAGVDVQVNSGGEWASVGRLFPRSVSDRLALPLAGASSTRLVFESDVLVNGFAGYAVNAQATASAVTTTVAVAGSSHEGASEALAAVDGPTLALGSGEQVALEFTGLPELVAGHTRSVFLDLRARHEGGASGATARQRDGISIPLRFALYQNLPNPFGRGTSIRFDVPRATDVRLEIFDAQGRRVRTLADRAFEPGSHVVAWDGRDDGGRALGASVYLCRMAAGEFRQFRTMVMVP